MEINRAITLIPAFGHFINYILLQGQHFSFSGSICRYWSSRATHNYVISSFWNYCDTVYFLTRLWWQVHHRKNVLHLLPLHFPRESHAQLESPLLRIFYHLKHYHFIERHHHQMNTLMWKLTHPICVLFLHNRAVWFISPCESTFNP